MSERYLCVSILKHYNGFILQGEEHRIFGLSLCSTSREDPEQNLTKYILARMCIVH